MTDKITKVHRFDHIEACLTNCDDRTMLFQDKEFQMLLEERLDGLFAGERATSVLSLDVFDTLLLRDDSSELTRFFEIGGLMAEIASSATGRRIAQQDAFLARYFGTKATYRCRDRLQGYGEGSLTEIHETASRILTGGSELAGDFIEAELKYEVSRTKPNSFLTGYMARHRAAGGRVILLTDMYMHQQHVATLLEEHGVMSDEYDALISSADELYSKASGRLFQTAEALTDATPRDFLHLGDSLKGDMKQAISKGWSALHLPLSKAGISRRRADHQRTVNRLNEAFSISVDIAMPA